MAAPSRFGCGETIDPWTHFTGKSADRRTQCTCNNRRWRGALLLNENTTTVKRRLLFNIWYILISISDTWVVCEGLCEDDSLKPLANAVAPPTGPSAHKASWGRFLQSLGNFHAQEKSTSGEAEEEQRRENTWRSPTLSRRRSPCDGGLIRLTWKYFLPPLHSPVRLQLFQQLVSDDLRDDVLWGNKRHGTSTSIQLPANHQILIYLEIF